MPFTPPTLLTLPCACFAGVNPELEDAEGNNASYCYYGLPSIAADDAAFPALGYWRGFVWGPMALLTYWGLSHEAVSRARHHLAPPAASY